MGKQIKRAGGGSHCRLPVNSTTRYIMNCAAKQGVQFIPKAVHYCCEDHSEGLKREMEGSRMKMVMLALVVMMISMVMGAARAAEAPAPSPTSDATALSLPTALASLVALAFAFF